MVAGEPGDIILFRFHSKYWYLRPWAWLIAFIQDNPVTHTAIVVDKRWGIIVESYWPRVRRVFFDDVIYERCYDWDIVRPVGASQEQRAAAARHAIAYVGTRYDLQSMKDLAKWLIVEKVLGVFVRRSVSIRDDTRGLFCQELVTQCYEAAGFPLAERMGFKDPSAITPKDVDLDKKMFDVIASSVHWPTTEV